MKSDKEALQYLKQLIEEVKKEMKDKKVLSEAKTPQKVFASHEDNMKKYIAEQVYKALSDSEK